MGFLDSLVSFFRHPLDFVQHAVCENNPQSSTCNTLTAFADALDGNHARSLAASTYTAQPTPRAPQAPVGCHIVEHRVLTPLRTEILLQQLRELEVKPLQLEEIEVGIPCLFGTDCGSHAARAESSAREVVTGCYIQHIVRPAPERLPLLEEMHRLPSMRDYDRVLRQIEARQPRVGCYIEHHEMQRMEPLQPDAGAAAPARRRH